MSYVSAAEAAKLIRSSLKAKGVPARAVSVRSDHGSINVSVKDENVSLSMVKAIAYEHESISRDSFGDILSGGNRYVFVRLDDDMVKAVEKRVGVDADGCIRLHGHKAVPLYDRDRKIGWYLKGHLGHGHLESPNQVVYAILSMDPVEVAAAA